MQTAILAHGARALNALRDSKEFFLGDKFPLVTLMKPTVYDFFVLFNRIPLFPLLIGAHIYHVLSAWVPRRPQSSLLYLFIVGFFLCFSGGTTVAIVNHGIPGWLSDPMLWTYYLSIFALLVIPPRCLPLRVLSKSRVLTFIVDVAGCLNKLDSPIKAMVAAAAHHPNNPIIIVLAGILVGSMGSFVATWEARLRGAPRPPAPWHAPQANMVGVFAIVSIYYLLVLCPAVPFALDDVTARAIVFYYLLYQVICTKYIKAAHLVSLSPINVVCRLLTVRPMAPMKDNVTLLLGGQVAAPTEVVKKNE